MVNLDILLKTRSKRDNTRTSTENKIHVKSAKKNHREKSYFRDRRNENNPRNTERKVAFSTEEQENYANKNILVNTHDK